MIGKLFQSLKCLWKREDDFSTFLYHKTGVYPNNPNIYKLALIHKSASICHKNSKINNERLEFLGDAILGAIVADILYRSFPKQKEGFLTKMRSKIISRQSLNQVAIDMELNIFLKASTGSSYIAENIYGNALEALIGAMYLDHNYKTTRTFIEKIVLQKHLDLEQIISLEHNFKSKLLEWSQKYKHEIRFNTQKTSTENIQTSQFHTEVILGKETCIGKGNGASKKESQQNASKKALEYIKTHLNRKE